MLGALFPHDALVDLCCAVTDRSSQGFERDTDHIAWSLLDAHVKHLPWAGTVETLFSGPTPYNHGWLGAAGSGPEQIAQRLGQALKRAACHRLDRLPLATLFQMVRRQIQHRLIIRVA